MASPRDQWYLGLDCFLLSRCPAFHKTAMRRSVLAPLLKENIPLPSSCPPPQTGHYYRTPAFNAQRSTCWKGPCTATIFLLLHSPIPASSTYILHSCYISPPVPFFPITVVSPTHPFILIWTKNDAEWFIFTWLKPFNWFDQQEGTAGIQNWES